MAEQPVRIATLNSIRESIARAKQVIDSSDGAPMSDELDPLQEWADLAGHVEVLLNGDPDASGQDPVMVMAGNPVEGFVLYGPAVPNTPEIEHLTDVVLRGDWWYVPITPMPVDPNA